MNSFWRSGEKNGEAFFKCLTGKKKENANVVLLKISANT